MDAQASWAQPEKRYPSGPTCAPGPTEQPMPVRGYAWPPCYPLQTLLPCAVLCCAALRQVRIMEDRSGVVLAGIEESIVKNSKEIFALLEQGSAKRRTAETLLNKQSSRSHSGGKNGRAGRHL